MSSPPRNVPRAFNHLVGCLSFSLCLHLIVLAFPWMQTLYQTNIVDATIWVLLCAEFTMFRCRCRIFGGFQVCFVSTLHPLFYLHPLCSTTEDMRAGFFYFYSYFSFLKYCYNLIRSWVVLWNRILKSIIKVGWFLSDFIRFLTCIKPLLLWSF